MAAGRCTGFTVDLRGERVRLRVPTAPSVPRGPPVASARTARSTDTTSVPLPRYAATPVPLNSTDFASGVSIVDGSRITFAVAGKFNILFSSQIEKGDAGTDVMSVWLTRRGANVPWTNTDTVLTVNQVG